MIHIQSSWNQSVWAYCKKGLLAHPVAFFLMLLGFLIVPFESILKPYWLKMAIDEALHDKGHLNQVNPQGGLHAFYGYILCLILFEVGFRLYDAASVKALPKFKSTLRLLALRYVLAQNHVFFIRYTSGALANRLQQLPQQLAQVCSTMITLYLPALITALGACFILSGVSWWLVFGLLSWIFLFAFLVYKMIQSTQITDRQHAKSDHALQDSILDVLFNIRTVQLFGTQDEEYQQLKDVQKTESAAWTDSLQQKMAMRSFFSLISIAFTLVGSIAVLRACTLGYLSLGDLVLVLLITHHVIHLSWNMSHNALYTAETCSHIQESFELLKEPIYLLERIRAKKETRSKLPLILHDINFSHDGTHRVLESINLKLNAGERIGVVGISGGGKSTLINLIAGLYPLQSGYMMIGHHKRLSNASEPSSLHSIAMLAQEPDLFNRSIWDNITYGLCVSEKSVTHALKHACAFDFVSHMPKGLGTIVGERGARLSRGQKQRLVLARFFLQKASIYLLDEALASLDEKNQSVLLQSIWEHTKGSTTIMVTHQIQHLAEADRIYELKSGRLRLIE
jgi:ATP-binding cassette, subfamily B, bacterial